jgi:hypothetical protein
MRYLPGLHPRGCIIYQGHGERRIRTAGSLARARVRSSTRFLIAATAAVEKTTCTASEDVAMLRSAHVDLKRQRKVRSPSLVGLLLILSSSETVAIKKRLSAQAEINEED